MKSISRFIPLILILTTLIVGFHLNLFQYFTFNALKEHQAFLMQWTNTHYLQAVVIYIFAYIIAVAVSIPGATILTLAGGYLFGIVPGTMYVVFSATLGSGLVFLAVQTAMGARLAKKAEGWMQKMKENFEHNAFNYLLALRLIPVVPFWAVNIVSPLLKVKFNTFMTATFFGIIPGSLVYVMVGNGLGDIFQANQSLNLQAVLSPSLWIGLLALSLLSLFPVVYKRMKRIREVVS